MNDVAFLHHGQPPRQPVARPKSPRRHTRISGQSLAKAERDPRELAHLTAGWLLGSVTIEPPTVALATRVFGVSGTLIGEATDEIEATTVAKLAIDSAWLELPGLEREEFIGNNLTEIRSLVEQITA